MKYLQALILVVLLASCEKDEIAVEYVAPPLQQGTFITQIEMSSDYKYRTYYDFESDSVVARHRKLEWDLAFASGEGDSRIRLNSSKYMSVRKVDGVTFEALNAIQGEGPIYDAADGSATAMDSWQSGSGIYIVDRGYDADNNDMGKVKVEILSMNEAGFSLRYAELGSSDISEITVPKDPSRNNVMLSFDDGVKLLEPPKEDWDILFTQYTLFFEFQFGQENVYYQVTGVLLNPHSVQGQDLAVTDFDAIDSDYLQGVEFSSAEDVIGYDWKVFDLGGGAYSIVDHAFGVNTVEGNDYKLQFTSFLDENGERGAPTFQAALVE